MKNYKYKYLKEREFIGNEHEWLHVYMYFTVIEKKTIQGIP